MEDNFKKEKNAFNCEKLYIPNKASTTQSGYGFGRRRMRKEQEPEKIVKKEETTIKKIEQKTSLTTKNDKRLERSRKKLEEPKKEEKNAQYPKYKITYSATTKSTVEGKQKEQPKKEEATHRRYYYRNNNKGNRQEKKEEPKKAERPSELAYTRLYKKSNFKLDDNRSKEKSEQNPSYCCRFSKELYSQNNDNNNAVKDNKNEKDNNENKINRFVYRGRYSINNTNEEKNNNHIKSENVTNKKEISTNKYNIPHGVKLSQKSITTTIPITSDIRVPNDYTSRRRIQQQKEIKQEQIKVKNNNIKIKERYNYEDSFSIAITDQNKIEEYLINLKNSNNIEEYYNTTILLSYIIT